MTTLWTMLMATQMATMMSTPMALVMSMVIIQDDGHDNEGEVGDADGNVGGV